MKKIIIFFIILIVILLAAYFLLIRTNADEDLLSVTRAIRIAENSECAEYGDMTDTGVLNNETQTWWLNMEATGKYVSDEVYYVCEVDMVNEIGTIHERDVIDISPII